MNRVLPAFVLTSMVAVACATKPSPVPRAAAPEQHPAAAPEETASAPVEDETVVETRTDATESTPGPADDIAALKEAAAAGAYLMIFFHRGDSESTSAMRRVFEAAVEGSAGRARGLDVEIGDAANRALVDLYQLDRAPMPLVLVRSPRGAITGAFPVQFTREQLLSAFVSRGLEECLAALQNNKAVLLCVQNAQTQSNEAAMRGVREFRADPTYEKMSALVVVDPADPNEARLMTEFRVDRDTQEAVTLLLSPPGTLAGTYRGAVSKEKLIADLASCSSGCGSTGGG
jgi:hypothetical protein